VITAQPELGASVQGFPVALRGMLLEPDGSWLPHVTAAWQAGRVSNLAYLLFLNWAAGRSFNDLAQYPVVPWVLADYRSPSIDLHDPAVFRDLTKPVGALNPDRLRIFLDRCVRAEAWGRGAAARVDAPCTPVCMLVGHMA
jgi:factor associated with neutral sphingomyelinase activation